MHLGKKGSVIKLTKEIMTEGLLNSVITQFLDFWYPSIVRVSIPLFTGEGPYEFSECRIKDSDIVIDAGANIGMFTWLAIEKTSGSGRVHAFEPIKSCFNVLVESQKESLCGDRVMLIKKALSDHSGKSLFSSEDMSDANTIISDKTVGDTTGKSEEIDLITLDQYVKDCGLQRVDFIKADIEGMEPMLIKGAEDTIKKYKPRLSICTYHYGGQKETLENLIRSYRSDYNIVHSQSKLFAW